MVFLKRDMCINDICLIFLLFSLKIRDKVFIISTAMQKGSQNQIRFAFYFRAFRIYRESKRKVLFCSKTFPIFRSYLSFNGQVPRWLHAWLSVHLTISFHGHWIKMQILKRNIPESLLVKFPANVSWHIFGKISNRF